MTQAGKCYSYYEKKLIAFYKRELQGMANVSWNYLRAYSWALEGIGPKKLKYKAASSKFIGTGIPSNDRRFNILVRILGAGQNILFLLEAWEQRFLENEAEMLELPWQNFGEDVDRLRGQQVRMHF